MNHREKGARGWLLIPDVPPSVGVYHANASSKMLRISSYASGIGYNPVPATERPYRCVPQSFPADWPPHLRLSWVFSEGNVPSFVRSLDRATESQHYSSTNLTQYGSVVSGCGRFLPRVLTRPDGCREMTREDGNEKAACNCILVRTLSNTYQQILDKAERMCKRPTSCVASHDNAGNYTRKKGPTQVAGPNHFQQGEQPNEKKVARPLYPALTIEASIDVCYGLS